LYNFSAIFLLLLSCALFIQAKNEFPTISYCLPACYINPSQHQQSPHQIFSTFNCGLSSHHDSYYRHQHHVQTQLNSCCLLPCGQQYFYVQPEDGWIIEKICADNPHISVDTLRLLLARNPAINNIQNLHAHGNKSETSGFQSDIFIDKHHFEKVENSAQRIKILEKAAQKVMKELHASELKILDRQHKNEKNAVKKEPEAIRNAIENRQKKDVADLKVQHAKEKKHPLGKKKSIKPAQVQTSVTTSNSQQQNISSVATSMCTSMY